MWQAISFFLVQAIVISFGAGPVFYFVTLFCYTAFTGLWRIFHRSKRFAQDGIAIQGQVTQYSTSLSRRAGEDDPAALFSYHVTFRYTVNGTVWYNKSFTWKHPPRSIRNVFTQAQEVRTIELLVLSSEPLFVYPRLIHEVESSRCYIVAEIVIMVFFLFLAVVPILALFVGHFVFGGCVCVAILIVWLLVVSSRKELLDEDSWFSDTTTEDWTGMKSADASKGSPNTH